MVCPNPKRAGLVSPDHAHVETIGITSRAFTDLVGYPPQVPYYYETYDRAFRQHYDDDIHEAHAAARAAVNAVFANPATA